MGDNNSLISLQAAFYFIVFLAIIALAYISTKIVGKKVVGKMSGKHMKVVETLILGVDKKLCLVQIDHKYVVIALSGKSIRHLITLDAEFEIAEDVKSEDEGLFDFSSIFSKHIGNNRNEVKRKDKSNSNENTKDTIKKNISKLKDINNKNIR